MKDIDFDELDRAVSSVLKNTNSTAAADDPVDKTPASVPSTPPARDLSVKNVHPKPTANPLDVGGPAMPASEPNPSASHIEVEVPERPAPPAIAARLRGGRFMDVVHPSSDVKTDNAPRTPAASPSSKPRLAPISPEFTSDAAPQAAEEPESPAPTDAGTTQIEPVGESIAEPVVKPTAEEAFSIPEPAIPTFDESAWPDPTAEQTSDKEPNASLEAVEVSGLPSADEFSGASVDSQADPEPVEEATDQTDELDSLLDESTQTQTPFITDAKVEKRPLGAFVYNAPDEDTVQEVAGSDNNEQNQAASVPSMESDTLEPELAPVDVTAPQQTDLPDEVPADVMAEVDSTAAPAIFNSQEYHQPLTGAHPGPSRLKRVMMVILITLLLLVVGAGIGYGVYVYQVGL